MQIRTRNISISGKAPTRNKQYMNTQNLLNFHVRVFLRIPSFPNSIWSYKIINSNCGKDAAETPNNHFSSTCHSYSESHNIIVSRWCWWRCPALSPELMYHRPAILGYECLFHFISSEQGLQRCWSLTARVKGIPGKACLLNNNWNDLCHELRYS